MNTLDLIVILIFFLITNILWLVAYLMLASHKQVKADISSVVADLFPPAKPVDQPDSKDVKEPDDLVDIRDVDTDEIAEALRGKETPVEKPEGAL